MKKTIAELAGIYGVHPTQIKQWKSVVESGLPDLFSDKRRKYDKDEEEIIFLQNGYGEPLNMRRYT